MLAAGQNQDPLSDAALEKLCHAYWYPLYAYVRRLGHDEETAKDLTQAFFERLLEKNYLAQANRELGSFRSFLLAALKHFLSDEWDKSRAVKRGGGQTILSLDDQTAENRYEMEATKDLPPDQLYDRSWAEETLAKAAERLRLEYQTTGKSDIFERVQEFLSTDWKDESQEDVARRLCMTTNTLKSHVFRLRRRNREIIREIIAETVEPGEVDDELRDLAAALTGKS